MLLTRWSGDCGGRDGSMDNETCAKILHAETYDWGAVVSAPEGLASARLAMAQGIWASQNGAGFALPRDLIEPSDPVWLECLEVAQAAEIKDRRRKAIWVAAENPADSPALEERYAWLREASQPEAIGPFTLANAAVRKLFLFSDAPSDAVGRHPRRRGDQGFEIQADARPFSLG